MFVTSRSFIVYRRCINYVIRWINKNQNQWKSFFFLLTHRMMSATKHSNEWLQCRGWLLRCVLMKINHNFCVWRNGKFTRSNHLLHHTLHPLLPIPPIDATESCIWGISFFPRILSNPITQTRRGHILYAISHMVHTKVILQQQQNKSLPFHRWKSIYTLRYEFTKSDRNR